MLIALKNFTIKTDKQITKGVTQMENVRIAENLVTKDEKYLWNEAL